MPEYDPFTNDVAAKREALSKKDENRRLNELSDLLFVMNDPAGRRFIHRQLTRLGVFRTSYTQGDTHHTAFNEGARNHGLWLLAEINEIAKAQYLLMMEEAQDVHSDPA